MKAKNKESKCIIFLRVSTTSQTTDGQSNNVIRMAEASGYTKEQMYFIEEQESGIKLSEEERLGLNKMKQLDLQEVRLKEEHTALLNDIEQTQRLYDAASAPAMSLEDIERLSSSLPEDVRKKKQIVRRQIKEIKIGEWNVRNVSDCKDLFNIGLKKKRCMDITVEDIYGYVHTFRYWPRCGFGSNRIEEILDD